MASEAREEIGADDRADRRVVGVVHRRGEAGCVDDERGDSLSEIARWTGEVANREP